MGSKPTKVPPAHTTSSGWKQLTYNPHCDKRPDWRVLVYSDVFYHCTRGLSSTFIYKANGVDHPPISRSHFRPHQLVDFQEGTTTMHRIELCWSPLDWEEPNDGAIFLVSSLDTCQIEDVQKRYERRLKPCKHVLLVVVSPGASPGATTTTSTIDIQQSAASMFPEWDVAVITLTKDSISSLLETCFCRWYGGGVNTQ